MQHMTKHIQVGDWIYEIKAVRALKVESYGQPYSAIANININGDSAYIDGLLTKDDDHFDRKDFNNIISFCRNLDLANVHFDRYKNGTMRSETVKLQKASLPAFLKVVS
ncbi:hypothetical protein [Thalassotalea atypica]|uniref:hypothetical protein n=1 Tax=Thalassotalea atypica TaxID=2054316 RepID=UPI0025747FCA|nr:hypothetical protein [Thalassotalea atypica]